MTYAELSTRHAAAGRACAAVYAERSRAAAKRILELTNHCNTGLNVGDKWRYMMSATPGPWGNQRRQFETPPLSDFIGIGPANLDVMLEGADATSLAGLSVYTQGRRFIDLYNKGKGTVRWNAKASQPWVRLSTDSDAFETQQRVWLEIDWDRAPKGVDVAATVQITSNGGEKTIRVPVFNPAAPRRDAVRGFVESHGYVSMEAEHFTRGRDQSGAGWRMVQGLGRSGDGVTIFPATVESRSETEEIISHSPALEYEMHLFTAGRHELHIDCLPTRPTTPDRGVRLAFSIDGGKPIILDARANQGGDVLANLRRYTATLTIEEPGHHTLTLWMVDPGVVIDKLVLYTAPPKASYLGPPESYRR